MNQMERSPRGLLILSIQIRSKTVPQRQICTANKNFDLLIFLNENSLTDPEQSAQACRPERWGSMRHQQVWWTLKKER
jgi:hypothetical protein